jgi:pilus assembly protein CpaB
MPFRMKFIVPVAVLVSALATFGLYRNLQKQGRPQPASRPAVRRVVVAATALPMGRKIEASDVKTGDWPAAIVPEGCLTDAAAAVGRVVKTESQAGEAILESKLAPAGSEGGFSSIIPEGMRALTVSVNNASGVGGFILPNTRVDVLVTVSSPADKEESVTRIILEDIRVLAVDQTYERKEDDPVLVQTVTLLVTPADAEKLVLASTEGKLQLSLRNATDRAMRPTSGVQLRQLIVQSPAAGAAPAVKPSGNRSGRGGDRRVVEVIRSAERAEVTFSGGESRETRSR